MARYWSRTASEEKELELNEHHMEAIYDYLEEAEWCVQDIKTFRDEYPEKDWLKCFILYICTILIDYVPLRRFVWSIPMTNDQIVSQVSKFPFELATLTLFIWDNMKWLKYLLPNYIKILNGTVDAELLLM